MPSVKLVAIINSFNRLSLLKSGLAALVQALEASTWGHAIVVFDAGSTDGSREWLKEFSQEHAESRLHILCPRPGEDSSFAGGVNAACSYAGTNFPEAKWYLLYETDNFIAGETPLLLAEQLLEEHAELAAVGFTVSKHTGQPAGFGSPFPSAWQFLLGQQLSSWLGLDCPRLSEGGQISNHLWEICDVVYTSPLMVRRTAWEQSRGMDALNFPFSDCDLDWSWRLYKSGWRMAVLHTAGVVHDNKAELSTWSGSRVIHFHQARLKLLGKHLGTWVYYLKPLLFLRHLGEFTLLLPLVLFGFRPTESLQKRWQLMTSVFRNYNDL